MRKVIFDTVSMDYSIIKFNERLLVPFTVLDKGTTSECYFAELKEIGISAVHLPNLFISFAYCDVLNILTQNFSSNYALLFR